MRRGTSTEGVVRGRVILFFNFFFLRRDRSMSKPLNKKTIAL